MPCISKETIEHYFITRQLKDDQSSNNLKALELGEELLKTKRIRAISINVKDTAVFFSGIVASAVKMKVSYCFPMKVTDMGSCKTLTVNVQLEKGHQQRANISAVLR